MNYKKLFAPSGTPIYSILFIVFSISVMVLVISIPVICGWITNKIDGWMDPDYLSFAIDLFGMVPKLALSLAGIAFVDLIQNLYDQRNGKQ